jgi:hypothetical protein
MNAAAKRHGTLAAIAARLRKCRALPKRCFLFVGHHRQSPAFFGFDALIFAPALFLADQ